MDAKRLGDHNINKGGDAERRGERHERKDKRFLLFQRGCFHEGAGFRRRGGLRRC